MRVVTGAAVPVEVRVARLGSRALALVVDLLLQTVLFGVLWFGTTLALGVLALYAPFGVSVEPPLFTAASLVILVCTLVGYPAALLTLTRGRTVGKLALGLRVVRDDGGPVGFRHALTRTLVGVAVEFPALVLPFGGWVLSVVLMLGSRDSKRLGDHAAGTVVLHDRALEPWGWVPAMPPGLAGWATTLDLTDLDDELALAVRHFLARNRRLREPARSRLGHELAGEVAQVTSPPPPSGTPGWAYLAAVHAERHARAARQLSVTQARSVGLWPALFGASHAAGVPEAVQAPAARHSAR